MPIQGGGRLLRYGVLYQQKLVHRKNSYVSFIVFFFLKDEYLLSSRIKARIFILLQIVLEKYV